MKKHCISGLMKGTGAELQLFQKSLYMKCQISLFSQRRMVRLVQDDRKAMVSQISTLYKHGEEKSI